MEYLTGVKPKETKEISELLEQTEAGTKVKVNGAVHTIRDMGTVAFVILRKREGLLQCVYEEGSADFELKDMKEAATVEVEGILEENEKAPNGIEIRMESVKILSEPEDEMMPLAISKWKLNTSLEAKLNYRSISLRNIRERAKFRIQEGLTRAFRDFLYSQEFTEIHTPKIGAKGAEGGANIFKLEYFHRPAVLAQSPQFYKQMMVGVFDRVFETAPVFRAEKHNTKRHLNEYTSLDFEMGYIDGFEDIMAMETGFLQYAMELLKKDYARELKVLGVELPDVSQIPAVKFADIKEIVAEKYNHKMRNPFDLEPEEEVLIGRYAKEEWGSDFVFVTHYPSKKRPFYAMDDPEDPRYTLSFDQRLFKRALDLIIAVPMTIIASPVMLFTAAAIKLYDKGPVFYKQIRCTKYEREFEIYKFRSMIVNAEGDGVAKLAKENDERITPVGKFIRATRVDELPQLFNIIKGDMSFVGPRPERPEIMKQYCEEMPEFPFRTRVKAGLTGYAQVYGKYNTTPYDKLKLDLFYIENYSLWTDIKLILMTVKTVLKKEATEGVADNQTTAEKNVDENAESVEKIVEEIVKNDQ